MTGRRTARLMNVTLEEGQTVLAYVPMDGREVRTVVGFDGRAVWAKLPGADAGVVHVNPAAVYGIGQPN